MKEFKVAITNQLRELAEQDDTLGRGEFELLEVVMDGWDYFTVRVRDVEGGEVQKYRITVVRELCTL